MALVTCADLPGLDPDDRLLAAALAARGVRVEAAVWDDGAVDWSGYDLAVLRSTWDYPRRAGEFVAWARTVPRLANPAGVVAWNSDKRYLGQLAAAGVPVVPTTWLTPDAPWAPTEGEIVVKPAVSAGGIDAGRYDLADPAQRDLAAGHVARLQAAGRLVMMQPYLGAVDTAGETAVLFLGGRYSHAIRKGPLLTGPDLGVDGLFRQEDVAAREPAPAERALADQALGALPFPVTDLLYARVDLVPGPTGEPVVIEVELVEPSLFLSHADGAADRLATAVLAALAAR